MLSLIKAVIFDLDGTLVNSLEDLAISTNYALKSFGFPIHETEDYKYFVGDGIPKLIERALPKENRDIKTKKAVLECFLDYYREHYVDKTTVYDGIEELLSLLYAKNIKLAVLSNKAHEMAVTVANKLLPNKFSIVYGKQEGFPTKPDASLTLQLISKLGVDPSECLFVGDSGMDMAAALNAKCFGVGVLWGFRKAEELSLNGAKRIISNPLEIVNIIEELNNEF